MKKVIEMFYILFCTKSLKSSVYFTLNSTFPFELAILQVLSSHSMAMGLEIVYSAFLNFYLYCFLLCAFQHFFREKITALRDNIIKILLYVLLDFFSMQYTHKIHMYM